MNMGEETRTMRWQRWKAVLKGTFGRGKNYTANFRKPSIAGG